LARGQKTLRQAQGRQKAEGRRPFDKLRAGRRQKTEDPSTSSGQAEDRRPFDKLRAGRRQKAENWLIIIHLSQITIHDSRIT